MSLEAITLLIEPPRVDLSSMFPPTGKESTSREFFRYERFAAELRKHTSAPVTIIDDFLVNAPAKGMILVESSGSEKMIDELPASRRQEILARVVFLQANGAFVLKDLEQFRFAAAIEIRHYMEWRMQPELALQTGLYGLRSMAPTVGAECPDRTDGIASKHYCYLTSDRFDDLPSILAAYLEALAGS